MKNKRVMVFGVFDGLHKGHLYFLREVAKYGKLIAVVARDSAVKKLKNKTPKRNERERLRAVRKAAFVYQAVLGDKKQGGYAVVKQYKPDIICLGYDQKRLKEDLKRKLNKKALSSIKFIQLMPHQPQKLHSSLLQ